MSPHAERGERGAAALSLLTVGMMIALGIVAVMALPLTQASDAKAKSNSAADAAALAGVDSIRLDLRDALTTQGWLGSWDAYQGIGGGIESAKEYASRNDATLVAYHPDLLHLEVYARVRGRTVDGHTTESQATAKLQLPICTAKPDDSPTPAPDASPPAPDAPPTPVKFSCDGIDITIHPSKDDPGKLDLPLSVIDDLLNNSHAKLVS